MDPAVSLTSLAPWGQRDLSIWPGPSPESPPSAQLLHLTRHSRGKSRHHLLPPPRLLPTPEPHRALGRATVRTFRYCLLGLTR